MGRGARKIRVWARKVTRYSNRWWYGPAMGFILAADAFIVFIPNEPLIAFGVLAKPRKWLSLGLWMTLGSALGAALLATLVGNYSDWILSHLSQHIYKSKSWHESVRLVNEHGLWGLALVSFSPLPQHAAVILVGLTRMPIWEVFVAVFVGRIAKYLPIAWLAAKSPAVLKRWKMFRVFD
jgi:membrane protein YqaA with SNARE-associated domain